MNILKITSITILIFFLPHNTCLGNNALAVKAAASQYSQAKPYNIQRANAFVLIDQMEALHSHLYTFVIQRDGTEWGNLTSALQDMQEPLKILKKSLDNEDCRKYLMSEHGGLNILTAPLMLAQCFDTVLSYQNKIAEENAPLALEISSLFELVKAHDLFSDLIAVTPVLYRQNLMQPYLDTEIADPSEQFIDAVNKAALDQAADSVQRFQAALIYFFHTEDPSILISLIKSHPDKYFRPAFINLLKEYIIPEFAEEDRLRTEQGKQNIWQLLINGMAIEINDPQKATNQEIAHLTHFLSYLNQEELIELGQAIIGIDAERRSYASAYFTLKLITDAEIDDFSSDDVKDMELQRDYLRKKHAALSLAYLNPTELIAILCFRHNLPDYQNSLAPICHAAEEPLVQKYLPAEFQVSEVDFEKAVTDGRLPETITIINRAWSEERGENVVVIPFREILDYIYDSSIVVTDYQTAYEDEENRRFTLRMRKKLGELRDETLPTLGNDQILDKASAAIGLVPRALFVPRHAQPLAYRNFALHVAENQTISAPLLVLTMTALLRVEPDHVVGEIGTMTGFQAGILSRLAKEVYTIEYLPKVAERANDRLKAVNCNNVEVVNGDGSCGIKAEEGLKFDRIIVTCTAPEVPKPLFDQLKEGGFMLIPLAQDKQSRDKTQGVLTIVKKIDGQPVQEPIKMKNGQPYAVSFVPMLGEHGWKDEASPAEPPTESPNQSS